MDTYEKISLKEMQSIQGKLQFASIAIPLGKPLLSTGDLRIAEAEHNNWKDITINRIFQKLEGIIAFNEKLPTTSFRGSRHTRHQQIARISANLTIL